MEADNQLEADEEFYPPDASDLDTLDGPPVPRAAGLRRTILQRNAPQVKKPKSVAKAGKRILAKQKQRQALELRKAGASYVQIAEQLGYADASGASKAVKRAFGDVIQEPVQELRAMQIERLNHMLLVIWPKAQTGDERAIQTARGLMQDINDLMGTAAAQQVDVSVTNQSAILVIDGNETDYINAMKRMAGIQSDGTNAPKAIDQTPAPQTVSVPTVLDMTVVDAELVDDEPEVVPAPARPAKKSFKFGVDPTVRRDT